jgi:hypothetical protein
MFTKKPQDDLAPVVLGVFDVTFAFAKALEVKGLLSRQEIAAMPSVVKEQAEEQAGGPTPRSKLAEILLPAVTLPIAGAQARARFRVVEGDGGDEPPPAAA